MKFRPFRSKHNKFGIDWNEYQDFQDAALFSETASLECLFE